MKPSSSFEHSRLIGRDCITASDDFQELPGPAIGGDFFAAEPSD